MFDTEKSTAAQKKYCHEHGFPVFAPGLSGKCYRCGKDIYQSMEWADGHITGITVEEAGNSLVTGCPHCHYSFVD